MNEIKRIVCLANSRKLAGRCIAGREWLDGEGAGRWIRAVSNRENGEVSEYERQYEDGRDPRVLDIIDVPVKGLQPVDFRTENRLLDPEFYWEKVGFCSPIDVRTLVDPIEQLWIDGHSTHHGRSDKIPIESIGETSSSLRLVGVERLVLRVFAPGEMFGNSKRRVQG